MEGVVYSVRAQWRRGCSKLDYWMRCLALCSDWWGQLQRMHPSFLTHHFWPTSLHIAQSSILDCDWWPPSVVSPPWSDPQWEWAPSHCGPLLLSRLTRPAASGQACYCHGNHMCSRPGGTMSETAWSIWEGNRSLRANLRWKGQGTVVPHLTELTLTMSRVALKVTQYHTLIMQCEW